jgi:hypothetical protein
MVRRRERTRKDCDVPGNSERGQIADLALLHYSERGLIRCAANRRKGTTRNRGQINDRTL